MGVFCFAAGRWALSTTATLFVESVGGALLYVVVAYCAFQTVVLTGVVCWEAWNASQRRKGRLKAWILRCEKGRYRFLSPLAGVARRAQEITAYVG